MRKPENFIIATLLLFLIAAQGFAVEGDVPAIPQTLLYGGAQSFQAQQLELTPDINDARVLVAPFPRRPQSSVTTTQQGKDRQMPPSSQSSLEAQLNQMWRQQQISAFESDISVPWSLKVASDDKKDVTTDPAPLILDGKRTYLLAAGSVIPAMLITGLNSDLPGHLTAQISENVYDSPTGQTLLIPQGSRLFGEYQSTVIDGQKRPLVRWQRVTFPDGSTLALEGMAGTDRSGYAGFRASVNNHYSPMLATAVLFSVFAGLAESLDDDNGSTITISQPTITLSDSVPVGMIMLRIGSSAPSGWHILDGSAISSLDADDEFLALAGDSENLISMSAPDGYVWCIKTKSSESTLLSALASSGITTTNAKVKDSLGRDIGAELADTLGTMAEALFAKQLARAPTLVVKPGYRFHVLVNRAVRLPAWEFTTRALDTLNTEGSF